MSCLTLYHTDAAETVLLKDIEIFYTEPPRHSTLSFVSIDKSERQSGLVSRAVYSIEGKVIVLLLN